jgi:chromate transporter
MDADSRSLLALVLAFAPLSLVSVGGGPAVIAEMQHQSLAHGWMTQQEFTALFAISRVAPGPGALLAPLIGWKAAGWLGVSVVSLAFFVPSSILVYGAVRVWDRWRGSAWQRAVEAGLAPIMIGLVFASAYAVLRSEANYAAVWAIALFVAACRFALPKLHPLVLIGLSAAAFPLLNGT